MKSIPMSSHILVGMGKGCNNPGEADKSGLQRWQMSQFRTYCYMSLAIPFQKNKDLILAAVTSRPECPPIGESCNHFRINSLSSVFEPMTSLPFLLNSPLCHVNFGCLEGSC